MVQGTMSNSGKSFITAGLCRVFAQDGYRTAPFKSQNMALNSYITKEGLEMGRAQVMQAEAAGVTPSVDMNPILLKPTSHVGSQVIVGGRVRGQMKAMDYFNHKKELIPEIMGAFHRLRESYDIIVIEGAGSPAEINLKENDIVNMGLAKLVNAPVLLVGDIDRGGVFAALYGTVKLLEPEEQARICGLIINKFRGDRKILEPGVKMIEDLLHIPVVGLVPMEAIDIDDEDSLSDHLMAEEMTGGLDVVVIRLPHISNFTDFTAFERMDGVSLRYADRPSKLGNPHLILLPGTKNTMDDLLWMRNEGLEKAILRRHREGVPVLGICGGYQIMGKTLSDPEGAEGGGSMPGMGILPTHTVFKKAKTRSQTEGRVIGGNCKGCPVTGYEIHMGHTVLEAQIGNFEPWLVLEDGRYDGVIDGDGKTGGTYLHGIFDNGAFLHSYLMPFFEKHRLQKPGAVTDLTAYKEAQYDKLAELIRSSLDMEKIYESMGGRGNV